ncbi:ester cyclase [Aspergillus alliaceus]|uniref:ester cyclase n=1 Tax=Petromyces alliaceus TaxID=209559 RepID=UPI0012A63020|nr:SnoaL-domain-containing protein [Aspergillus alliaceus]KAB8227027.1 SnoaL-domain-containing protein [Aspergillus alliaceus]
MASLLLQRMRRFVEFINSGDETIGQEVVSEAAVFHVPFSDTPLRGLLGYMQILGIMRSAYPDIQWTLDDTVIEDNRVVAQFTLRGTHEGEFLGVPASGKKIQARAMNIYRFSDGMIVEETGLPDLFGMMLQIGGLKPPASH